MPYHDLSEFDETTRRRGRDWNERLLVAVSWLSQHFFSVSAVSLAMNVSLGWLTGKRREKTGPHRALNDGNGSLSSEPSAFLRELERIASNAGLQKGPGQTWHELMDRLAERVSLPSFASEVARYHYQTAYAGKPRDEASKTEWSEKLRTWRETDGGD
jgi:hypothetical protein